MLWHVKSLEKSKLGDLLADEREWMKYPNEPLLNQDNYQYWAIFPTQHACIKTLGYNPGLA